MLEEMYIVKPNKEAEIENLMNLYGDNVVRWAYMILKDKGLAEDIAQEVFITCYMKYDSYRGEASIKTWLYRITANRCKDLLKSRTYRTNILTSFLLRKNQEQSPSPEMLTLKQEEDMILSECLFKLPLKYREPLILFYYENLKITEIAELLKKKENTVKSLLTRGRKLFKEQYERGKQDETY